MKLYVLTENTASGQFLAEFGLSYLIEVGNQKILFDSGHSDVFLRNAEKLKLNLDHVETVVLSHGHWDHGNGLKYIENKTLICHPGAFIRRYRKNDSSNIGLDLNYETLKSKFRLITSKEPYPVSENVTFLGEIPRVNDFEAQTTTFEDENRIDDYVPDDSALAINVNNELVVVSGCAHAGICNTVEYARSITGLKEVKAVIGGFHLKENNVQTKRTIAYFRELNAATLLPSHCTQLPALAAFYDAFRMEQVQAGMIFNF